MQDPSVVYQAQPTSDAAAYERGIAKLLDLLVSRQAHPAHLEALTQQARLRENLEQANRFGDNETRRSERAAILARLNELALAAGLDSFNILCELEAAPGDPPYMGLRCFDESDAALFFGRQALITQLLERLRSTSFLAIVGASGSGKSSLVRAGLLPALRRGDLPGSQGWPVHLITPGAHPLENLAASLTRNSESVTATTTLIDDLRQSPRSLHLYVKKLLTQNTSQTTGQDSILLLLVDQFEELFTQCKDTTERQVFIDNLLTATAEETAGPLHVLITLRADFYHLCALHAGLRERLSRQQEYIGAMSQVELRQAIEEPAHRSGWVFEAGLVDLILHDAGDGPGALPLLSHALLETWKQRRGRTLTLTGYQSAGGVSGAIAHTAEALFTGLDIQDQAIARSLLLRLTELGEGTQDTRRRAALDELLPPGDSQFPIQAVLRRLADARLVTTHTDSAEVAHEALIREWPRLREWLEQDRQGLRLHRHLTGAAQAWAAMQHDPGELYRGVRLAQAAEWAAANPSALNPLEQEFLQASQALVQEEEAKREAQRQREVQLERRRARQVAFTLSSILLALLVIVAILVGSNMQVRQEQTKALARQLAAQAQMIFSRSESQNSALVALLGAESLQRYPSQEGDQAVRQGISLLPRTIARMIHTGRVTSVAFSPDGSRVLSGDDNGSAIVWEAATGKEIAHIQHEKGIMYAAFSPDGRQALTGSSDGSAIVWEATTGKEIARILHDGFVQDMAFSPDGRRVLSGGYFDDGGNAIIWDTTTGEELARMQHESEVNTVAFSPDGRWALSGDASGSAIVWEVDTGKEIARVQHEGDVSAAAFSPDGHWVLSGGGKYESDGSNDGSATIWESATGKEIAHLPLGSPVTSAAFSQDGHWALTGSGVHMSSGGIRDRGGRAAIWEAATGKEIAHMQHEGYVSSVAFSPDGSRVLSSGERGKYDDMSGSAIVWEAATGKEIAYLQIVGGYITSVAFSPDGHWALTGSGEDQGGGRATVWEAAGGRETALLQHVGAVTTVAFSPDGRLALSGSGDGAAIAWEITTGKEIARMQHTNWVYAVDFSPDGRWALSSSNDGSVIVWETATGKEIARMQHDGPVQAAAFSLDGHWVLSGSSDNQGGGSAITWEAATGIEVARMPHEEGVVSVAFSPDGRWALSGSRDGSVVVWEAATGKEISRMQHTGRVNAVAFSPDGRRVLSGGYFDGGGNAIVWETATGKEIARIKLDGDVSAVAFSPDGRWALSGSRVSYFGTNGSAVVWNVASGRKITRMPHEGEVTSVAFSPDGRWVLTGSGKYINDVSSEGSAIIWNAASGEQVARMQHAGMVNTVAFSPDGHWALSGSNDGRAIVWPWLPADLIAQICQRVERNLTWNEWQQYVGAGTPYHATCPGLPLPAELLGGEPNPLRALALSLTRLARWLLLPMLLLLAALLWWRMHKRSKGASATQNDPAC